MARPEVLHSSTPDETLDGILSLNDDKNNNTIPNNSLLLQNEFTRTEPNNIGGKVLLKHWRGTIRSDGTQPPKANVIFAFANSIVALDTEFHSRCIHKVSRSQKFQSVRKCFHHARRILRQIVLCNGEQHKVAVYQYTCYVSTGANQRGQLFALVNGPPRVTKFLLVH